MHLHGAAYLPLAGRLLETCQAPMDASSLTFSVFGSERSARLIPRPHQYMRKQSRDRNLVYAEAMPVGGTTTPP